MSEQRRTEDRPSQNTGLFREPRTPIPGTSFTLPRWVYALALVLAGSLLYLDLFLDPNGSNLRSLRAVAIEFAGVLILVAEVLPRGWTTFAGILRLLGIVAFASAIIIAIALIATVDPLPGLVPTTGWHG